MAAYAGKSSNSLATSITSSSAASADSVEGVSIKSSAYPIAMAKICRAARWGGSQRKTSGER